MITVRQFRSIVCLLLLTGFSYESKSQLQGLDSMDTKCLKIYYTKGHKTRAMEMASCMQECIQFADSLFIGQACSFTTHSIAG